MKKMVRTLAACPAKEHIDIGTGASYRLRFESVANLCLRMLFKKRGKVYVRVIDEEYMR